MLDSFWNSLELEDISDLNYTTYTEYSDSDKKQEVLEKIDWVILKLHRIKDSRKYDYDIVVALKNKIKYQNCSLSIKGVDYLNLITSDLKNDTF